MRAISHKTLSINVGQSKQEKYFHNNKNRQQQRKLDMGYSSLQPLQIKYKQSLIVRKLNKTDVYS